MPPRNGELKAREFLFLCEDLAIPQVPAALRPHARNVMWTTLQLHYGEPAVHYELQPMPSRRQVEVGLHFESSPAVNDAWAALIGHHAPRLQSALGLDWELEVWTATWRRLHRVYPIERLTRDFAAEVAAGLACLVEHTGAMLRDGLAEAAARASFTLPPAAAPLPAASPPTSRT